MPLTPTEHQWGIGVEVGLQPVRDGDKVNGTGTVLSEVKRSWNKSPDAQRRSVLCREMALDGVYADTMGATADASSEALTAFALATEHRPASRDQCM